MKAIVTGAAGFIGSHVFDELVGMDWKVWGVDNYSIGQYRHHGIYQYDLLTGADFVAALVDEVKPDVIFHLAAWAHEGLSQFMPRKITENNYNAYLNILTPAIKAGVKRVVFCSSMSVYGDQKPPFDEIMKPDPRDIYAVAKTAGEQATELLAKVYGFEYAIIRPHNVYGERQALHDPYRNVVGIFINRMMRDEPCYIYGDGNQHRAFSYIKDVSPYIVRAGIEKSITQETINIGPASEYTINQLYDEIAKHFPDRKHKEPVYLPDRPLEVREAFCTNDRAVRLLGYKTQHTFSEGIKNMVDWAKTVGPQEFQYLDQLELENERTPITWKKKL
jgi:UDP-glucose 4-epimerase